MKCFILFLFLLPGPSSREKLDTCGVERLDTVFKIYEGYLDSYFRKFAEALSEPGNNKIDKGKIRASVLMYRTKLQIVKRGCREQFLKNDCRQTEMELIKSIIGLIDLNFEYEFPGLDYKYYRQVHRKAMQVP
jgi:hypothetical protein